MFWLFNTNFLLLPALAQSAQRSFFWSSYDSYRQESLLFAAAIILLGMIAFCAGSKHARRRLPTIIDPSKPSFLLQPLKPSWRLYFLLIISTTALGGLVSYLGPGFFTISRDRVFAQVAGTTEFGLIIALPRALAAAILILSMYVAVQAWKANRKIAPVLFLIIPAAVGLNAIINFPLAVARYWFFGILLSLIMIYFPLSHVRWRGAFVVAMTFLQFTLFPYFSEVTRGRGFIGVDLESVRRYLLMGDFDGFQTIVNCLQYVEARGLEFGRNLISVALFFIPRTAWANKAEPLGMAAAKFKGYAFTNLSAPIYAELYADFGLVSLVLLMFLLGWATSILDGYYDRQARANILGVGYLLAGTLAGFLIIILRGSLLSIIALPATLLGVITIASFVARRARGRKGHYLAHNNP